MSNTEVKVAPGRILAHTIFLDCSHNGGWSKTDLHVNLKNEHKSCDLGDIGTPQNDKLNAIFYQKCPFSRLVRRPILRRWHI